MRFKLNLTIISCMLWLFLYSHSSLLQSYLSIGKVIAIEYFLLADALYFAIIMFVRYNPWSWTITSILFFLSLANLLDQFWGNPLVYTMDERMFLVVAICASFYIGFFSRKKVKLQWKH